MSHKLCDIRRGAHHIWQLGTIVRPKRRYSIRKDRFHLCYYASCLQCQSISCITQFKYWTDHESLWISLNLECSFSNFEESCFETTSLMSPLRPLLSTIASLFTLELHKYWIWKTYKFFWTVKRIQIIIYKLSWHWIQERPRRQIFNH